MTADAKAGLLAILRDGGARTRAELVEMTRLARVTAAADALVSSGMAAAGYNYVNIDDCWAERNRDADGNLVPHKTKFPNGIKAVADYIHSKGLKVGIYSSAGDRTCTGPTGVGPQPGSIGFEQKDADLWASWGIDYLKYDNCGDRKGQSALQRYTAMGTALRNTGRDIVYSVCNWGQSAPWEFGPTVAANLWRTTGDIADNWPKTLSLLDQQKGLEPFAKVGAWNDPDMLEVGNGGMTDTEYRSHFSLWALLNAPLLAGNDLSAMDAATKTILTNTDLIAVNQDWGGSQGRLLRDFGNGTQVWGKPMSDGSVVAVLFNRNTATTTVSTTAAEIGLGGSSSYQLKDLWSKAESTTTGAISASVAGHGVAVFKVTRTGTTTAAAPGAGTHQVGDLPWLASSNGWGPVERNRSNGGSAAGDGQPLTIGGTVYAKGIGVHADSAVHVYLGRACHRFEAKVGVDAEVGTNGSVRFQVYGDGVLLAYTDVLRGGAGPVTISVPTKGYRNLELRTTDSRNGIDNDHADWADAQISCGQNPSNGSYAGDRTWTSSTNGWGPVERNVSNGETPARDGTVLTLGGVRYRHGIGAHADSTVTLPVNGACHGFDALVGVDAEAGSAASVIFEVIADGTTLYTSPVLRPGETAQVAVPLRRPASVSLVVRATADGKNADHADWAGARLSCD
ncbi:NPCBM/NEW2 domain-containing protein [Actinocorallia sp. A-T 12471]|uniref:NPCBM/NEW2 domain-containing protein n=1 Tax=Actinocorallia sp. A-T 12471 TaxID=3089813 RepID=UPI0029CE7EED|nr:NPCBM/NEW2 domain-containing protein [Actinocorallia sp. A-T 12471]MDX6740592.1 NPCBM/NEW2 domain-containing protein [Actinocorallia sp. A-T 12471]